MLTITLEDSALKNYLGRLQDKLGNLTPVMARIGATLETRVSNRFETRTDPNGSAWRPWAKATVKSYPKRGSAAAAKAGKSGHGRLLDRYGDMLEGLSYQASATSVSIGFDKPYATYHEWGTRRMPRRGLLTANPATAQLGSEDRQSILDIVQSHLRS